MRTRTLRILLVIGALIVPGACDDFEGPPTAPDSTAPAVTSLTISGNTSITPGQTTRLTATARYSDGTTKDVTAEASWSSPGELTGVSVLSVISRGLIRGERSGWGMARADLGGEHSATARVRVAPDGVFLLTVAVSDRYATDAARVQVTSPAGTFSVTTDLWGVVVLPAAGDATLQVEKEGFRTITMSLTVTTDQSVDVTLQPSESA